MKFYKTVFACFVVLIALAMYNGRNLYESIENGIESGTGANSTLNDTDIPMHYFPSNLLSDFPQGNSSNGSLTFMNSVDQEHFDWRDKVQFNDVKDQYSCGSCWCFCSVFPIEAQILTKKHERVILAEQELVDCAYQRNGCEPGSSSVAFHYVYHKGIALEADYPYKAAYGTCQREQLKKRGASRYFINSYKFINCGAETCDHTSMKRAILDYGPISFGYYQANKDNMADKSNGHCVALVGWTVQAGVPYWIFRNSWGKGENNKGYGLLQSYFYHPRNKEGFVQVTSWGYPIINHSASHFIKGSLFSFFIIFSTAYSVIVNL